MAKVVPLCQPAQLYLIFVIVTVVLMIVSFLMNSSKLSKKGGNSHLAFMVLIIAVLLKLMFGFFVTGVLDYLCKSGRENWSWFIILSMVAIVVLMGMAGSKLES